MEKTIPLLRYIIYGSQEAQNWVSDKLFRILSSLMAAGMRRQATRAKLSEGKRQAVDDCAQQQTLFALSSVYGSRLSNSNRGH